MAHEGVIFLGPLGLVGLKINGLHIIPVKLRANLLKYPLFGTLLSFIAHTYSEAKKCLIHPQFRKFPTYIEQIGLQFLS